MNNLDIRHHTVTASCHYLTLNKPKIKNTGGGYVDTDIIMFSYEDIVLICDNNNFYVLEGNHKSTIKKHIEWFLSGSHCIYLSSENMQLKFAKIMCRKSRENYES